MKVEKEIKLNCHIDGQPARSGVGNQLETQGTWKSFILFSIFMTRTKTFFSEKV